MIGTVAYYAIFLTAAVVIAELLLLGVPALGLFLWRTRYERRAKWAAIAKDLRDVKARRAPANRPPGRPITKKPHAKTHQDRTDDPANHPDTAQNGNEAATDLPSISGHLAEPLELAAMVRPYMHAAEAPKRANGDVQ